MTYPAKTKQQDLLVAKISSGTVLSGPQTDKLCDEAGGLRSILVHHKVLAGLDLLNGFKPEDLNRVVVWSDENSEFYFGNNTISATTKKAGRELTDFDKEVIALKLTGKDVDGYGFEDLFDRLEIS